MTRAEVPQRGRVVASLAAGSLAGWLSSKILGEYEFAGLLPFVAGPVVGLIIAEVVVKVGRWRDPAIGVFCSAAAALSMVGAGRIGANPGDGSIGAAVWVAAALGAAAAYGRVRFDSIRGRFR